MSTSAITPISQPDYGSSSATASQQSVFNNLISQLEQSISGGDLTTTQTLLNAVEALSPSSASGNNPLGAFLTSLGTALNDGSVSEAQSALATYQSASPATTTTGSASAAANTSASAASIASGLVLSQIQLNLVSSLLGVDGPDATSPDSTDSSSALDSLLNILNAVYQSGSSSSGSTSSTSSSIGSSNSTNPYDALVSAIQSSLATGTGPATTALAYLNPNGNFVNTSA